MVREFDSPWKEALELFLEQLLLLLFPDLHAAIDWSKGYESLDKELHEIVREAELGPTLADKLFRVFLLDGNDIWLLLHVEVQAQPVPDFPQRMFVYYYRILDRYNHDVVGLAILGDDQASWRPNEFTRECFGCEIRFRFRALKLLDWAARKDELEASLNPSAFVVLAHLESLTSHEEPEQRKQAKWQLIRRLLDRGGTAEQVRQIYRLIDWFLELPAELAQQLGQQIHQYEEEKHMPYVTSIERLAKEEGRVEGEMEGEKKGQKKELLESLMLILEQKFGESGVAFAQSLSAISDLDQLREIRKAAVRIANSLDELRAIVK